MYTEIELGGKNRKIRYDFNALSDLEGKAEASIAVLASEERMGFSTIRLLLWAGLKWEDRGLTLDRVGGFIEKYVQDGGSLLDLVQKCMEALQKNGVIKSMSKDEGNEMTETTD